jgi:hypothetical protein
MSPTLSLSGPTTSRALSGVTGPKECAKGVETLW